MNGRLSDTIEKLGFVVNDGAMATELEAMGCDLNDELWSAKVLREAPEFIKKVHMSYYEAGADVGCSASYQATVPGLIKKGCSIEEAEALIKLSVRLARSAADEWWNERPRKDRVYPLVAASVGSYGAYLADGSEYRGCYSVSRDELKQFHARRMELLRDAGADFFAIETIPSIEEGGILAELSDELGLECWICFSCRSGSENCEGTPIGECAKVVMAHESVKAVGVNCTPPQYVESLIREIKSVCALPVCVYPNSGEEYDPVTKSWHGATGGATYVDYAKTWLNAGASIIGGCCRTTPRDIRAVYELIEAKRASRS